MYNLNAASKPFNYYFLRFQRIQQRLREGQQACDLLFLIALKSLKKSFEMAFESKQGISDLEKFCLELDEEDRRKKEKAQKKRDKKSKQKLNRSNRKEKLETSFCNSKDVIPTSQVPVAPSPTVRANPNKAVKAADKDVKAEYPAGENDAKIFPPPAKPSPPSKKNGLNNHKSSSSKPLAVTKGKAPVIKSTLPVNEFPSLESMLILDGDGGGSEGSVGGGCGGGLHDFNEEDVEGGENLIPLEDIRAFQARLPVVAQQVWSKKIMFVYFFTTNGAFEPENKQCFSDVFKVTQEAGSRSVMSALSAVFFLYFLALLHGLLTKNCRIR